MIFSFFYFVNLSRNIISLEIERHPWGVTEITPSFIGILPHVRFFSGIEVIWYGWEALRYDMFSKMVDEMDSRGTMVGNNQSEIRDILRWFWYDIMG